MKVTCTHHKVPKVAKNSQSHWKVVNMTKTDQKWVKWPKTTNNRLEVAETGQSGQIDQHWPKWPKGTKSTWKSLGLTVGYQKWPKMAKVTETSVGWLRMMMMKNDEKSNIFSRMGVILFEKWPPILGKRGFFRGFPPLQKRGIFKIFSTARVCSRARLAQALGKH